MGGKLQKREGTENTKGLDSQENRAVVKSPLNNMYKNTPCIKKGTPLQDVFFIYGRPLS